MDEWGMDSGSVIGGMTDPWQDQGGGYTNPNPGPVRKRFHLAMFFYALVGGILGAVIGAVIYKKMYEPSGNNVLMVGLVLGVIALMILLACALCEMHKPRITVNQELNLVRMLLALLAGVVVFGVGCLCEFLYELNSASTAVTFNDIIFCIDDSLSMLDSDPDNIRYSALADTLDDMDDDDRVGLVRFTEEIYVDPIDLDELDKRQREKLEESISNPRSDGNTNIYNALMTALEMHEDEKKSGRHPVVVLLSDGHSPLPVDELSRDFLDAGVAISTVSLGGDTDEDVLRELADATGGQFIQVDEADDLTDAFRSASTAKTIRCLFNPRPAVQRLSVLYIILRVLFLLLPGAIIGFFILWLMQSGNATRQILVSCITGLLAGVVMELGTLLSLPLMVVHIASWLLYSIVLLSYNDIPAGVRPTKFDMTQTADVGAGQWGDLPMGDIQSGSMNRGQGGSNNRIDRGGDDWGQM